MFCAEERIQVVSIDVWARFWMVKSLLAENGGWSLSLECVQRKKRGKAYAEAQIEEVLI